MHITALDFMALEQLSLATASSVDGAAAAAASNSASVTVAVEGQGGDEGSRVPRLPRWTRQEILVLIQGKRVAENRVRRGRTAGMAFGSGQVEPKWASVSSYCKRHGVNRGPVQCRKRWSNLAGDYKKIKEWESQIKEDTESFWVMRNDLRRERKLPGFFDREVYDILDGAPAVSPALPILSLAAPTAAVAKEESVEVSEEAVFDSGRSAAAEDGLFSDQEDGGGSPEKEVPLAIPAPMPISEKQYQPIPRSSQAQSGPRPSQAQGTSNEKQPASAPELGSASQDGRKRKRTVTDGGDEEATSLQNQLIDIMERNGKMLNAQLEAQNSNFQLEREQRKDHADSLVAVLNKLADALGKIADKL